MSSVLGHWIRFVKERQTEDPGVFGPHGGFGRAYALNEVLSTGAMMAGPILSGVLQLAIGYYYMNVVFGEFTRPVTVLKKYTNAKSGGCDVHASLCPCVLVSERCW